ncbi:MAG: nickel insertion protein [Acidaminobacteraceae bacterium]
MFITFSGEVILESIVASIVKLDLDSGATQYINDRLFELGIRVVSRSESKKKTILRLETFEKIEKTLFDIALSPNSVARREYVSINDVEELLDILNFEDEIYKSVRKYIVKLKNEIANYDDELIFKEIFSLKELALKLACFGFIDMWSKKTSTIITIDYPILGVPSLGSAHKYDIDKYDISVNILKDLEIEIKGDILSNCDIVSALFLSVIPKEIGASLSGKVKSWSVGSFENNNDIIAYIVDSNENHVVQYMIETNIDDMNSEQYEIIEHKLFKAGALDVYKAQIIMKKGRPAVKLSILTDEVNINALSEVLFLNSTTLGFRMHKVDKIMMERKSYNIKTPHGVVNVKAGLLDKKIIKHKAEFDDVKAIALKNNILMDEIYDEVDVKFKKIKKKHNGLL